MSEQQETDAQNIERVLLESYLDLERRHADGKVTVITRTRKFLEIAFALQLGLFIACFSIFLVFLIANLILHL